MLKASLVSLLSSTFVISALCRETWLVA